MATTQHYRRIRTASRRNAQSTFRPEGSQGPQIHPDDESDAREKDDGDFDPCQDGTDDGRNPEFDDDDNAANDMATCTTTVMVTTGLF